jgi:hypothetical protein
MRDVDGWGKTKTSGGFLPGPSAATDGGDGGGSCKKGEHTGLPVKHEISSPGGEDGDAILYPFWGSGKRFDYFSAGSGG